MKSECFDIYVFITILWWIISPHLITRSVVSASALTWFVRYIF